MKNLWLIYSIGLLLVSYFTKAQSEINVSHKSIDKEIRRTFSIEEYQLCNLQEDDSTKPQLPGNEFYFRIQKSIAHFGYLYIGRVNCCRLEGCSVKKSKAELSGFEYFDYFILYDSLHTIKSVNVFNYQATHGHEICSRSWLRQFKGYTYGAELELGNSVDAISGATVSVVNITYDIERASAWLNKILEMTACFE